MALEENVKIVILKIATIRLNLKSHVLFISFQLVKLLNFI